MPSSSRLERLERLSRAHPRLTLVTAIVLAIFVVTLLLFGALYLGGNPIVHYQDY